MGSRRRKSITAGTLIMSTIKQCISRMLIDEFFFQEKKYKIFLVHQIHILEEGPFSSDATFKSVCSIRTDERIVKPSKGLLLQTL